MILEPNLHSLGQGLDLLATLDVETYAEPGSRSPIGAHLRHCIDYYRCFLRGLGSARIDYDARERDPAIETDPRAAAAALRDIQDRLRAIDPRDFFREVEVKVDTDGDQPDAWSRSTLARELRFLASHTVHHYALIALLLRQRGVDPGEELGVAPSTLAYRAAAGAAAR